MNKMKDIGISVEQLFAYLASEMKKGHGDYKIFVTDDEEANGYHALWYLGETAAEMDYRDMVEDSNCDISILGDEKDKAIYLG